MIIRKYGIVLTRLKEGDIELVRQMRNVQEIRRNMYYREEITSEMQKKWFATVNNMYNFYFIIEHDGNKIGLINGKDNDYEKGTCEGGIFIWNKGYIGTHIPSLASVILNDLTFHTFHLINTVYAKVVGGNKTASEYNKLMGYEVCLSRANNQNVHWLQLTKENYQKHIRTLRKGVALITGDDKPLSTADIDFTDNTQVDIDNLYKGMAASAVDSLRPRIMAAGLKV
jgi:UDP-4-amino-4,6-dideoxy-N-acetyl-beta-L-altrosamine N-acetyltransferase